MGTFPLSRAARGRRFGSRPGSPVPDDRGSACDHRPAQVATLCIALVMLTAGCGVTGAATSPPTPEPSPDPDASGAASPAQIVHVEWEAAGVSAFQLNDYFHAVALVDGRVLVVGSTQDGPLTQIWDPASGAWRESAPLNKSRYAFAGVALADGRVMVAGGLNEGSGLGQGGHLSFSSTYVFDPAPGRESWLKVGEMGVARTAPAVALLRDGRVLVAGGYFYQGSRGSGPGSSGTQGPPRFGFAWDTAELFDPITGTWSDTGSMQQARAGAAAVTLTDGRVLVVGSGSYAVDRLSDDVFSAAEVFDPRTGRFSPVGSLPAVGHDAIAAMGIRLPDSDGEPWSIGTLVALPDGGALLVGRTRRWRDAAGHPLAEVTRTLRFDAWTGSWTMVGSPWASAFDADQGRWLATPGAQRQAAFVARLADGRVLIAGGTTGDVVTTSAEIFLPATGEIVRATDMPEGRADGDAVPLPDGSVMLVGGYASDRAFAGTALRMVP